ncbi:MAG: Na+/H+ antiporter subunit E [Clostridia bacterium]|nr:Na+/H+ antiporter subunit E [Clostridia bacterium]MDD4047423.1 Na+/H+ antiporter subunit E [Clostridia bacterium]
MSVNNGTSRRAELIQFVVLSLALFVFWFILSGRTDAKHIIIGIVTAIVTSWICRPVLRLKSTTNRGEVIAAYNLPYIKLIPYIFWLLWEVVKANIDVALLVLNPKMPIEPLMVKFKKSMSNPVAHALLANSITLTPGTITVDVQDGVYTIHALTKSAALSLAPEKGEGEMPTRVGKLFNEK